MLLFGGIFYAVFAEGTVQPWAEEKSRDDSEEKTSLTVKFQGGSTQPRDHKMDVLRYMTWSNHKKDPQDSP